MNLSQVRPYCSGTMHEYPAATLRKAWELVCLNQFHDIIPGGSINAVHAESLEQYAEVKELGDMTRNAALEVVGRRMGHDFMIVNPTFFARNDLSLTAFTRACVSSATS